MNTNLDKLKELIEENLLEQQMIVDDIGFEKVDKNLFLKIVLDRPGGIDLDSIVEASKIINKIINKYEIKEKKYILDISSKERNNI